MVSTRQLLQSAHRTAAMFYQVFGHGNYDVPHGVRPDELNFPRFAASFHKLLEHESSASSAVAGLLTSTPGGGEDNYNRLLSALRVGSASSNFNTADFNNLNLLNRTPPGGLRPRILINPRSSKSLSIKGSDPVSPDVSRILYGASNLARLLGEISFSSEETAAEITEVYAQSLLRTSNLGQYSGSDTTLAINALNSFDSRFIWGYDATGNPITAATRTVTADNLFRGPTMGDLEGDYLSVFLKIKRPPLFPAGCSPEVSDLIGASQFANLLGEPLAVPLGADEWFGLTVDDYVKIQNAEVPVQYRPGFFSGRTPIQTGRDIGNYVHVDNSYEEYIRAADILTASQIPRSDNSPYTDGPIPRYKNEGDGPTLGPPDAWGLIGGVRILAERATFAQKWLVARRARPEVMAALIHLAMIKGNAALVGPQKLNLAYFNRPPVKALLDRVSQDNQTRNGGEANYLLSQMFPEGSPAHPSWPSAHATIAGACVTVIKAIFDDCAEWFVPDTNDVVIVGHELDKLASNIALARDFAGVHFRRDGEDGIRLGEEIAIRYLQDHARTYREEFRTCDGFKLTKRNGTRICITPDSIEELAPCPEAMTARAQLRTRFLRRETRRFYGKENL
jgi:hypothetical protein